MLSSFLGKFLSLKSRWSDDNVEGIVIANYKKQIFGKISRFDVSEEIEKHHLRKEKIFNY